MKPHHKLNDMKCNSGEFNRSPHCLFIHHAGCLPTCSHEFSSSIICNTYSILFIVVRKWGYCQGQLKAVSPNNSLP